MVYEAHSTDYQTPANLRALVQRHFAILKVGPGLTFAMREALWALDQIERRVLGAERSRGFARRFARRWPRRRNSGTNIIRSKDGGSRSTSSTACSDRIRYYWPCPRSRRRSTAVREFGREPAAAHAVEPIHAAAIPGDARRELRHGRTRARTARYRAGAEAIFHGLPREAIDMTSILQMDEAPWSGAGALWTAREIAQQPSSWRRTQDCCASRPAGSRAFLAPLLARSDLRIILTGAGSSAFIGECLAPLLLQRLGRRVEAIATTDLLSGPRAVFPAGGSDAARVLRPFGRQPRERRGDRSGGAIAARVPSAGDHLQRTGHPLSALPRRGRTASRSCCRPKPTIGALR